MHARDGTWKIFSCRDSRDFAAQCQRTLSVDCHWQLINEGAFLCELTSGLTFPPSTSSPMMMQPAVCMVFRFRSLAMAIDEGAMMPDAIRNDPGERCKDGDAVRAEE